MEKNYAQEIAREVCARSKKEHQDTQEKVNGKVVAYLQDNWKVKGGVSRTFTEEECVKLFGGHWGYVQSAFEAMGFEVIYHPSEEIGHLWWKKSIPAKWEMKIPEKVLEDIRKDM